MLTEELTSQERERYSRHLLLPEVGPVGQERLKGASVLCIGGRHITHLPCANSVLHILWQGKHSSILNHEVKRLERGSLRPHSTRGAGLLAKLLASYGLATYL